MKYISTRNASHAVSGSEAILMGISPEGGLFVPESFPQVTLAEIEAMGEMSYDPKDNDTNLEDARSR